MDRISPPKFPTLPEEISSTIIRRAGKGGVSKRQLEVAKHQRYEDAGTKPISPDEALKLKFFDRIIFVFGSYKDQSAGVYFFSMPMINKQYQRAITTELWVHREHDKVFFRKIRKSDEEFDLRFLLNDIWDTEVSSRRLQQKEDQEWDFPIRNSGKKDKSLERYADIVLPDIRCIFHILHGRFSHIKDFNSKKFYSGKEHYDYTYKWVDEQTRKYTKLALDNIVDHYAPGDVELEDRVMLPFLMIYLSANVNILNLDIDLPKTHKRKKVLDKEYLSNVQDICTFLYGKIVEDINNLFEVNLAPNLAVANIKYMYLFTRTSKRLII